MKIVKGGWGGGGNIFIQCIYVTKKTKLANKSRVGLKQPNLEKLLKNVHPYCYKGTWGVPVNQLLSITG